MGHRARLPLLLTAAAAVALILPFFARAEGRIENLLIQHTLQMGASLCALAAAAVGFAQFVALRQRLSFFLGLSYLTAGFTDLLHIYSLHGSMGGTTIERTSTAMGAWLAGRMGLALFLLTGILLSRWLPRNVSPRRMALLMTSAAVAVVSAMLFLFVHCSLPILLTFTFLPRPWELLPAVLFGLAFYAYLRKAQEKDAPACWGWVVLSIMLGFFTQLYMAQSSESNDTYAMIAYLLKIASYLLPVIGLYVDSVQLFHQHIALSQELVTLNDVIEAERNQLRTVIDLLPAGIFITHSPTGAGSLINRKGIELLGASILHDTGTLGYSPTYNLHRSDGQPYPPEELPLHRALATGAYAETHGVVLSHPDGHETLLWSQAVPIKDKTGNVTGAISVYHDVTEKQRYERQLKHYAQMLEEANDELDAILQSMAAGVFAVNAQGYVTTFNSAAEEILGIERQEVIGQPCAEIWGDACAWEDTFQPGAPYPTRERIFKRRDGRRLILSVVTAPLRRQGQVVGAVEIFSDITLLKEAEKAQATIRAQNQFLSTMSHELRTPLNSVLALSQLLLHRGGTLNDNQQECLEVIHRNGQHLLRLINDLMDLTKMEAGKVEVTPSEFYFADVLDWVLASVAPLAAKKGLTIRQVVPDDLPLLETDENKVNQVLFNLLSNAIKFTNRGGRIEVVVSVCRRREFLSVSVRDTGIGIPAHQIPLVFERFRQLDEGMVRKYGGVGLGLTICQSLVELLGGHIECESEVGVGSTFTFTIPVRCPCAETTFSVANRLAADVHERGERRMYQHLGESQRAVGALHGRGQA
jgi:PAS domain S-box-containing protein